MIRRTLSIRLSLMMVLAIGMLLIVALIVMFHFSWLAMKAEARGDAEQTLEGTSQQIDNILSVMPEAHFVIHFRLFQMHGITYILAQAILQHCLIAFLCRRPGHIRPGPDGKHIVFFIPFLQ